MAVLYTAILFGGCTRAPEVKPPDSRFTVDVLVENLDEPMGMTFLPDEKVLIAERKGALKQYDPVLQTITTVGLIPVNTYVTTQQGERKQVEEGMMGVIAHPHFATNHWIFLYYADAESPRHLLTRWECKEGKLVSGSEKIVLAVPITRKEFKCAGGSMAFDKQGNLLLATGANTSYIDADTMHTPAGDVLMNTNEAETAGNTDDLRGKILRIHPEDDGSYSIPKGNLFPAGRKGTRPEIYVMGTRNPWRISVDGQTGSLFWADPGRDDDKEDVAKNNGKGWDEFNVAKGPGNYGWPFFVGDNHPYYAPAAMEIKEEATVFNAYRKNSGLKMLPPAQSSLIEYQYGPSPAFPLLGAGGRSAVGGPVYRRADFAKAARPFPAYYEGKWFITDFIRGWIMVVQKDDDEQVVSVERFLPHEQFSSVLDMQFSPQGDLYLLLYGSGWFAHNKNARLIRISYQAGNRKPVARILTSKTYGSIPFLLQASGKESHDADGDTLHFEWTVTGPDGSKAFFDKVVNYALVKPGRYTATLKVTDPSGATSVDQKVIWAGNEQPTVHIRLPNRNQTFYFPGDTLQYEIDVTDKEEGSAIRLNEIKRSIDYFPMPYGELTRSVMGRQQDVQPLITPGGMLINKYDCRSCHLPDRPSVGPSFQAIAQRYDDVPNVRDYLSDKIIRGGSGQWGPHAMIAHPQVSVQEANHMLSTILAMYPKGQNDQIPLRGNYAVNPSGADQFNSGAIVLEVAYSDKGTAAAGPATATAMRILRSPFVDPEEADAQAGLTIVATPARQLYLEGEGSYLGFHSIDLSGITGVQLFLCAEKWKGMGGGLVECRLDSMQGNLLGITEAIPVRDERLVEKKYISFQGKQLAGRHNLYFIFRNGKATPGQLLMEIRGILFTNQGSAYP